jgi:hypothetical protein
MTKDGRSSRGEMILLDLDVMALQEVKALLPSALSMAPTKP